MDGVVACCNRWEYLGASFAHPDFDGYANFYYSTAEILSLGSDVGIATHPVIDPSSAGQKRQAQS